MYAANTLYVHLPSAPADTSLAFVVRGLTSTEPFLDRLVSLSGLCLQACQTQSWEGRTETDVTLNASSDADIWCRKRSYICVLPIRTLSPPSIRPPFTHLMISPLSFKQVKRSLQPLGSWRVQARTTEIRLLLLRHARKKLVTAHLE